MLNIGRKNTLKVNRLVDFGAYLGTDDGREILLPAKYISTPIVPEETELDVFVYTDSEDRLIASTETPYAMVGEFAFLRVKDVNRIGAFLDWGITAKDLLVPYREQKAKMAPGGTYLVYVYLDDTTKRVVASSKIEHFLGNVLPRYNKGDKAEALVIEKLPIGYRCIVDNLHYGMIYANETYQDLKIGDKVDVYVKNVRDDGKIDLTINENAGKRTHNLGDEIIEALKANGGYLPLSDKSSPESIKDAFACSKRDFKQAIGHLYKSRVITINTDGIRLV